MTEKNNEQQPWEASFKDEATGQYSRTQNRRKSQRVSMVVGILVLIVIALSFVPVYKYLQALNKPVDATTSTELPATTSTKTTTTTSKVRKLQSQSHALRRRLVLLRRKPRQQANQQQKRQAKLLQSQLLRHLKPHQPQVLVQNLMVIR